MPFAMPQSRKSLFASSVPGQKGRTAGATLGLMLGGLIAAIPAGILALLAGMVNAAYGWLALAVGLLTGVILLVVLSRMTARRYLDSGPEILAMVSAGDRV